MDTYQPGSLIDIIRRKLALIEVIEMILIGLLLTGLAVLLGLDDLEIDAGTILVGMALLEGGLFLLWGSYLLFIRLARAGGRTIDVFLWVIVAILTGSISFWGWTILDINRLIVAKLVYRGDAPVEYAWSSKSKQTRKIWETMQKMKTGAREAAL